MDKSPNFSCFESVYTFDEHTADAVFHVPCNLEHPSDPWKRAERFSRRCLGEQQQPRPAIESQHPPTLASPTGSTYDSEILEWASLLDILQRLLQVLELQIHSILGSLSILDSLSLKGLNGLDLATDVVGDGLEGLEVALYRVDDGLVLEDGAVVREVDGRRRLGELLQLAARILVALLERLQRGDGLSAESEIRGDCLPVKLESCATL